MERFLDAIHAESAEVERSKNGQGIKLVDGKEIDAEFFDYFISNKRAMENEFYSDLSETIGMQKATLFCEVIASDWYDGKGLRNGPRVLQLKESIKRYLQLTLLKDDLETVIVNQAVASAGPSFSEAEIVHILTLNDQMMTRHIEGWKSQHSNSVMLTKMISI